MKCDISPEVLVSLLYNELESGEAEKIRQHLKKCKTCRLEFAELRETTTFMEKWEDETPAKTVFIREPASFGASWKETLGRFRPLKISWALSMTAAAAVILLFVFNFQASYTDGNWQVSFGKSNMSDAQLESSVEALLTEWQSRHMDQTINLIQESEARQRRDYTLALNEFAGQQEMKRQQDLQLVGQGLEGLQRHTEGRYYQTNTLINDLIRMSNYPGSQP